MVDILREKVLYLELLGQLQNADLDELKYSGSGIGFNARGSLSYLIVMGLLKNS